MVKIGMIEIHTHHLAFNCAIRTCEFVILHIHLQCY